MSERKPTKAKPGFYAFCFHFLKEIAREYGYNLVLHGSMDRDLDLIAIPWTDAPRAELELIKAFDLYLRGTCYADGSEEIGYMHSELPGGRSSYVINLNRGTKWNNFTDDQWYVDISVTPFVSKT
jgi:hypothetical protein